MFLTNLFNLKKTCMHEKITPDMEYGYCPDCGKLIHNDWYITRCSCCGVKMKAICRNGVIEPQNHYCTNCGSSEYIVEQISKINFIDINFAVLQRHEIDENVKYSNTTQCWQEKTVEKPKLLVQYL
ncbi:MAG: hypothetical protein MJ231_01980 [bacterium]|nr:hypothetical protein [bacterium]